MLTNQNTAPAQTAATQGTGSFGNEAKHRKAASLGAGQAHNYNSYSPNLGAMMEDAEDGPFEEGEIPERFPAGHQPRSQSQSFVPPRFAALAAQQEQNDSVGPTGRPQLAPGFMFGARKRSVGLGPAINEEDLGFQFPQQQGFEQQQQQQQPGPTHRKGESGEITGIMAEQVRQSISVSFFDVRLTLGNTDCPPKPN
jgi:protein SSD1